MADLKDGAPEVSILNYQLAEFFLTRPKPPTKPIEIIPSTWIVESGEQKRAICKFPPGPDYNGLQDMVKNLESYDDNWPVFPVTIKGEADTYEDAKLYLEKLEITSHVAATDPQDMKNLSNKSSPEADDPSKMDIMKKLANSMEAEKKYNISPKKVSNS